MSNDIKDQDTAADDSAAENPTTEESQGTAAVSEDIEVSESNEDVSEPNEVPASETEESSANLEAQANQDVEEPSTSEPVDEKTPTTQQTAPTGPVAGVAAFFEHPEHLLFAASQARDAEFERFDAMSPFPIHGMDDAMGLGRSWIPWVTFGAGLTGLFTATGLQVGIMAFDWPMVFGGRPFLAWPSFVPIMFELTVLFAGITTVAVMLFAAGCFRKPLIIDREITNNRFALWIAADDDKFDRDQVVEFMKSLNPTEIRTVNKDGK
jgi:hypothetical protein